MQLRLMLVAMEVQSCVLPPPTWADVSAEATRRAELQIRDRRTR